MSHVSLLSDLPRTTSLLVLAFCSLLGACEDSHRWSEGTAGIGESCVFLSDCARQDQPVACVGEIGSGATCRVVVRAEEGAGPCRFDVIPRRGLLLGSLDEDEPLTACFQADGLSCDKRTQTCELAATPGQECRDRACERDATCGPDQVCEALPKVGEACRESARERCVSDAYCNDAGTCEKRRGEGKKCTDGEQCLSTWCVNGECE